MSWCLVSSKTGLMHQLQPSMMFIGREDCEIMLQSRTIDKRHAVINYDQFDDVYTIKDVGSLNGTFVNEVRIPEQTYVSIQAGDTIRFGYDPIVYHFENTERVGLNRPPPPPPAPVYENDKNVHGIDQETSLRESMQPVNSPDSVNHTKQVKLSEGNSAFKPVQSRRSVKKMSQEYGSPLYGQPAWWGQDEKEDGSLDKQQQQQPPQQQQKQTNRGRSGTFTKDGASNASSKDSDPRQSVKSKSNGTATAAAARPDSLNLKASSQQKQHHRMSTDLKPADTTKERAEDGSELTIVTEGQKHATFTIEFKEKEKTPKMDLRGSLSRFIPPQVKERMDEKGRIIEEKKILRKIEEHLDLEPERDVSGREKFRHKKLEPLDLLAGNGADGEEVAATTMVESEELLNRIFMENKSTHSKSSSGTGTVLESVEMEEYYEAQFKSSTRSPLTRSKSMPTRRAKAPVRRKQPDPEKLKELAEKANEDSGSEAGTYTIESEKESKEEMEARKKIDEVFGVESKTKPADERDGVSPDKETHQIQGTNAIRSTKPTAVSQWITEEGTELRLKESPEDQQTGLQSRINEPSDTRHGRSESAPFHRIDSSDGRSSRGEPAPFQRTRSFRGKRVLPPTPGTRGSPAVSLRSMTPSDQQSHHGSASEREDASVVSDILSPTTATSVPKAASSRKPAVDADNVSIDTDILLKDTETVMAALENKLSRRGDESPLDASFASSFDDYSQRSSEYDLESDLDTASNVSLADGDSGMSKPSGAKKAADSKTKVSGKQSAQSSKTGKKTTPPARVKSEPRRSSDGGGIWNRLSRPNRHKVQSKDGSVSDTPAEGSKTGGKHERSQSYSAASSQSASRKTRTSPSIQPRMTRTTALRKSRFGDDSGSESTDISTRSEKVQQSTKKSSSAKAMKERLAKTAPKTGNRTKLGDTDWKSETSLGGMIVQRSLETKTSSTQSLNTQSSSSRNARTSSAGVLRSQNGPSAFKPVVRSKEQTSSKAKSGSSWRRYEPSDYSVSDSESTVTQVSQYAERSRRSVDCLSESETDHRLQNATRAYNGRHSAEIAKISSTLADDLTKLASGAEMDPKDQPKDKDDSLLDDMFDEETPSNVSGPTSSTLTSSQSASSRRSSASSASKKTNSVSRSTSFTMGLGGNKYGTSGAAERQSYAKQNGQRRKQWHSQSFDNLVLSSIYQLSLKLKRSSQKLAAKVDYLYHNDSNNLSADLECDVPVLKTASTELAEILGNLRKVEKRLDVINNILDPDDRIEVPGEGDSVAKPYHRTQLEHLNKYRQRTDGKRLSLPTGMSNSSENFHDDWDENSDEEYY